MPRGISAEHRAQRETILRTAAHAFAERGYLSTTMAQLAERCAVSKSLLYHYYASKDAILFDLTSGYMKRLASLVDTVEALGLPARESLAELVRRFVAEYETSREHHIVLLNDVRFLPEPERSEVIGLERRVVDAFARLIAATYSIDTKQAKVLTMSIFGMINWTFTWLRPGGPLTYPEFGETVVGLLEGGLNEGAARLKKMRKPSR